MAKRRRRGSDPSGGRTSSNASAGRVGSRPTNWTGRTGGVSDGDAGAADVQATPSKARRYGDPRAGGGTSTARGTPAPSSRQSSSRAAARTRARPRPGQARASRADERDGRPALPDVPSAPATRSFLRALVAVGRSPTLLLVVVGSVLLIWVAFTSYAGGTGIFPRAMVWFLALPPIHSFLDLQLPATRPVTAAVVVLYMAGIVAFRALLAGFLVAEIGRLVAPDDTSAWGGPADVAGSLRRALSAFRTVLTIELGYALVSLVVEVVFPSFLGPQLGSLAVFAWLFGGVFFLAQSEIAAVIDRVPARLATRLAYRASRLPGRDHGVLSALYLLFTSVAFFAGPGGDIQATPTITVWIYVLAVGVLQVATLGAYTVRWLVQREAIRELGASAPARPARRGLSSMFGAGR